MIGKNANLHKQGFGIFSTWTFPLNETCTDHLALEWIDFSYFPGKTKNDNGDTEIARGYVSVKLGYRKIFAEEGQTGFYAQPSAGYARVAYAQRGFSEALYGDGFALGFEAGYSKEVGERGNTITAGLKYEYDRGGKEFQIQSISFRMAFNFLRYRRR